MSNNRTEQQAAISALSATVDLAELKAALEQSGYVFKKDVVATITGTSGALVADFTDNDTLVSTITGNATYSFVGLENGQRAKLIINKGANDSASFAGISGTNDGRRIGTTRLQYDVLNINGDIILSQINYQFGGTLSSADVDLTINNNNVQLTSLSYGSYLINNNTVNFDLKITFPFGGTSQGFYVNIKKDNCLGRFFNSSDFIPGSMKIENAALDNLSANAGIKDLGTDYVILIEPFGAGSFSTDNYTFRFSFSTQIL